MSYQVYAINENPSVHRIPGALHVGKQIVVRGRMNSGGQQFSINLQNEDYEGCNIAFHFNPRHNENTIVRNSYEGDWGAEERDDLYHFPFGQQEEFAVRILVTESGYAVYGDGYHMLDFNHRLPYGHVNFIQLAGDCNFYDIAFQDRLRSPYIGVIPGNFDIGKAVRIRGVASDYGDRIFAVNFQNDPSGNDIAYHFNPRPNEEAVVRNSKMGDWGDEERDIPNFPFGRGTFFDMFIVGTESGFATFVNGEHFTTFAYRSSVEDVSHLAIEGDVEIADVQYFDQTRENVCKEIPSGLQKGDAIVVRGIYQPGGDVFSINLHYDMDADSDIALHFNPRRNLNQLVINNRSGGDWGEEVVQDLPRVFREDVPFDLRLVAKRNKIKIFLNGQFLLDFGARGDILGAVRSISMAGDAYIHQIKLARAVISPHAERIPGQINNNEWINFTGQVKKSSNQFAVNLQCGQNESDDIAFHFNPRLNESQVVRNTLENGDWQQEEREQPTFPFTHRDLFEVLFNVKPDIIRTYVNGSNFVTFNHRLPYERICHVQTAGDANFFQPEYI